jgi:uncharacterized protein (DUF58 family)
MDRNKIRLHPTGSCWMVGAVLAAMWLAAVNYDNALAYVVLFSVASLMLVSALQGVANLNRVELKTGTVAPVFAGLEAILPYALLNPSGEAKRDFRLQWQDGAGSSRESYVAEILAGAEQQDQVIWKVERRGWHQIERAEISTLYPWGILRTFRHQAVSIRWLAYPEPKGENPWPEVWADQNLQDDGQFKGGDDFGGVRLYTKGESQRHIDWKAVARGRPLMVKEFTGAGVGRVWFSWSDLPGLATEPRLSQLTKWVVEAEERGCGYGLRLPGKTVAPGQGSFHYHHCLRLLAEFGREA